MGSSDVVVKMLIFSRESIPVKSGLLLGEAVCRKGRNVSVWGTRATVLRKGLVTRSNFHQISIKMMTKMAVESYLD